MPAALADADALVVRSAVQVDDALMEHAPKLRVIGRAGVGVDNIDADAATRRGIVVMNTPGANAVAVAELTIGLMLALARKLPAANSTMHAGKWEKKSLQGAELRGKTLGILGLGRIGLEVARRARGFGLEIIGSDPFVSAAVARENGIALVPVEELFAKADYLTLHVGLTPQTTGIINAKTLATMKKGVRIINCARGELVDDAALAEALKSGQVAGAALDVFTVEPPKDSPYFELDNVILTPHIAGSTAEAQEAVGMQIAHAGARVSEARRGAERRQPALAEPRGVRASWRRTSIWPGGWARSWRRPARAASSPLHLIYGGALAEAKTDLVRNAAIAGLLQGSENVNRINAAAVAAGARHPRARREGGEPSRRRGHCADRSSCTRPRATSRASATVIHGEQPRLLEFDGIDIEAPLEGTLLVCRNLDVPGVIGQHRHHSGRAGREHRQLRAGPRARRARSR